MSSGGSATVPFDTGSCRNDSSGERLSGTASLKRVTLVRNETNHKVWEPGKREFKDEFKDSTPLAGENRYYLRVEQADGNMAWSSPVWVTVKVTDH